MATKTTTTTDALVDRQDLTELVSRLGRWLDDPASAVPEALLAEDVSVRSPGGEAQGRDRVVAQAKRTHEAVVTQHAMTDVLADVDGDCATMTANALVAFVEGGGGAAPTYSSGTRYRFGARRRAAGWRLTRIEVTPVWELGERPASARPKPA